MERLKSSEINTLLFKRLENTNNLYLSLPEAMLDNDELKQTIYVKFYLDFSAAIEAVIRNVQVLLYKNDLFIKNKLGFEKDNKPQFLETSDIKNIISGFNIDNKISDVENFYHQKVSIIKETEYAQIGREKTMDDYDSFDSYYGSARSQRNSIAHSLKNEKTKFDNSTLLKFMFSYFYLYKFYENLENK